jgi:hypothetical protein
MAVVARTLLLLCGVGTAVAFFPDLSNYPDDMELLDLSGRSIDQVPGGAFARFSTLRFL